MVGAHHAAIGTAGAAAMSRVAVRMIRPDGGRLMTTAAHRNASK
jgi:hypothetical protein